MVQDTKTQPDRSAAQTPREIAARRKAGRPYFREIQAAFLEGQLSIDRSCIRDMEEAQSDAMAFWVGGGSLYMH